MGCKCSSFSAQNCFTSENCMWGRFCTISAGVKLYSVWEMITEFSLLSWKLFILKVHNWYSTWNQRSLCVGTEWKWSLPLCSAFSMGNGSSDSFLSKENRIAVMSGVKQTERDHRKEGSGESSLVSIFHFHTTVKACWWGVGCTQYFLRTPVCPLQTLNSWAILLWSKM